MVDIVGSVVVGLLSAALGWIGSNVWNKHESTIAERWPITRRLGLAESNVDPWFDEAISHFANLNEFWNGKMQQESIHRRNMVKAREETERRASDLRELKTGRPESIPMSAVGVLTNFLETWDEEQVYLQATNIPEAEFRKVANKIESESNNAIRTLRSIRRQWKDNDL